MPSDRHENLQKTYWAGLLELIFNKRTRFSKTIISTILYIDRETDAVVFHHESG